MNRDEAKLILQSYRPGGRDAGDPYFAPALALAKQDAELAAWFAEQQAFDARISGALQQLRVPSRLKAEILAAAETKESPVATWWRNLFSRQSPVSWALAAVRRERAITRQLVADWNPGISRLTACNPKPTIPKLTMRLATLSF